MVIDLFCFIHNFDRMTEVDLEKLSTFHRKCLRQIALTFWPRTKSKKDLLADCNQQDMATILMKDGNG